MMSPLRAGRTSRSPGDLPASVGMRHALFRPSRRRFGAWAAVSGALAASGLPGCGYIPREAVVPMPTRLFKSPCAAPAPALLIILPGRGMTLRELTREGFPAAVHAAGLAVDVLIVDAHVGYYKSRSILERLSLDVVAPAQAAGHSSIWLAGISLGGLGALLYADAHPGDIEGVLALAPFLGEPEAAEAIAQAGGLLHWQAPVGPLPDFEIGPQAWRSVQRLVRPGALAPRPRIYLGYGLSDRLAPGERVLAEALPPDRVFTAPGGHDWDPWRDLWRRMLAASDLPRCADLSGG
jgi:pimeloyl-ACP methyl ester carboxylesterase